MYSSCDTPKGGFPHSEISGSKLICQLPEAYRRLPRPSSPVIAKASTICTYSLDPITLIPEPFLNSDTATHENVRYRFSKATFVDTARLYSTNWLFLLFHLFLGLCCVSSFNDSLHCSIELNKAKCFDFAINYYPFWIHTYHHNSVYSLYFFHFVKDQSS